MKNLAHIATRFVGTPLMMHPQKLEVILKALAPRLGIVADLTAIETGIDADTQRLIAHYQEAGGDADFSVIDGVAVIPVQGTLMKRCSGLDAMSGCCSYLEIEDQITQAVNDAGIRSVLLNIDSPGGEVSGCFELSDFIYSMRGKKPIYAVSNDLAASAAYAIASSADRIFVGRTGAVGSIGVFALHAEQAELDKAVGVKYTYVYAGKNKIDGNPHEPLSDRAKAEIQTEVDREYGLFTETVSRNRGAAVKEIVGTDARLFWADSAVPLLADEIGTFDDAMKALLSLNGSGIKAKTRIGKSAASAEETSIMAETAIAATAAPDCEEEEMKKAADPKDKKKDPPVDPDNETEGKKAAAPPATPVAALALAPLVGGDLMAARTNDDITAISNLCKMAGVADPTSYLTKMLDTANDGKRHMTVAEISNDIAEKRSAESGRTSVMNTVDTINPTGAKQAMDRLTSEATAFARANKFTPTSNMYVRGLRKGTTPEQAVAAALESNPEIYGQFRARHNAKTLVAQLQNAGVAVQFAGE